MRLPWTTPQPVAEGLRAIANRCTASQERQRYHNARTLLRALEGWAEAQAIDSGGPLALLLDRLRTVGHLPASRGIGVRVGRLVATEGQRTDEIAEQILADMALAFELLRTVNSAQVRGTQVAGNGPVLTLRRKVLRLLDRDQPRLPEELDLAEAVCALRWPKWPRYTGPIDPIDLRLALAPIRIDTETLQWLGSHDFARSCRETAGEDTVPEP